MPDAQPVFDRLPVGVLVYRLDHLLYANPAFLQWTGHQSLDGLIEAGGLDGLFIEPIGTAVAGDDTSLTLAIDRGDKISVRGELIDITWQGEPAHALVTAVQPATAAGEPEKLARTQAELAELEFHPRHGNRWRRHARRPRAHRVGKPQRAGAVRLRLP